jgi:DNA replication protein DnaC
MTAFLKIDTCARCRRALPWEWVPAVFLAGKPLAGTGVWRSALSDGHCADCVEQQEADRQKEAAVRLRRSAVVALLGGDKPYREFIFERFRVLAGNRRAYEAAIGFDPTVDNLYLWGPSGVGKSHLACAVARRASEESLSVEMLRMPQLVRKTRMRDPASEQSVIDGLITTEVMVFEDLGSGQSSAYSRQILREILDGRDYQNRAGLLVTSAYTLNELALRLEDDAIASRLAGLCRVIEVAGPDGRIAGIGPVRFKTNSALLAPPPTEKWG